jgi:hypothetical protein
LRADVSQKAFRVMLLNLSRKQLEVAGMFPVCRMDGSVPARTNSPKNTPTIDFDVCDPFFRGYTDFNLCSA